MGSKKMEKQRGVILFPLPAAGHTNPMFHLAEALHSKGIPITIVLTNSNSSDPTNFHPDYTFHFIDDGLAAMEPPLTDPMAKLTAYNSNCAQPFRDCLASVFDSKRGRMSVACLITDPLWQFTRSVCDEFGLPRIMLHTSTVADLAILSSPHVLQHEGYSLLPVIIEMVEEIKTSSGLICNSFEELEGPSLAALRQYIPDMPTFPIGPLHKYSKTSATSFLVQDQTPIISWLDKQAPKSVLYVSFGSIATITKAEFGEIAWGLANCKQTFLWVIRLDLVRGGSENSVLETEHFKEKMGERGHIVTWAPQQEVLAHSAIGGSFMHGGWNSTIESISEGVPIIVMPSLFPDQKTIAEHVSEVWKVGLRIEKGAGRGEIEEVITRLMGDDELRRRMVLFKEMVDTCLCFGGSSYNSLEKLSSLILSLE